MTVIMSFCFGNFHQCDDHVRCLYLALVVRRPVRRDADALQRRVLRVQGRVVVSALLELLVGGSRTSTQKVGGFNC